MIIRFSRVHCASFILAALHNAPNIPTSAQDIRTKQKIKEGKQETPKFSQEVFRQANCQH